MRWILLFLIAIPALEIALIILSGQAIGIVPTIFFIFLTGILGAFFAKKQGLRTLRNLQTQMGSQQPPGDAVVDGVCILIGGIFLLIPGFFTDLLGLVLLLPFTRKWIKPLIYRWIRRRMNNGSVIIYR
ncbi:FxsA family protein [Jeotgalibacillus soli]|uniref:Exlusion protein FxsA n=1 Tax=Jeotgalibacillus soli TaxID=889306 RepID=A0A0C2V458_9BACL|nr:FxsA family protein [Jeotgalibacillus soli]KIL43822.1 hypothetical protein KP78_36460 [Jeotgalibacillus soli]